MRRLHIAPFASTAGRLLALIASVATTALAQRDTTSLVVRGSVVDSAGRPLPAVEVSVPAFGRASRTDSAGRFTIPNLRAGPTRFVARRPGWAPADTMLVLDATATLSVRLVLARLATLDTVKVVARDDCAPRTLGGFECRRRAGVGVVRNQAELAALNPLYIADLLDGVDGIRRTMLRTRKGHNWVPESTTGWRCIATLVNGRRPFRDELENMSLSDVVGVEYYSQPQDVPDWYKIFAFSTLVHPVISGRGNPGPRTRCALLVLWLRGAPRE